MRVAPLYLSTLAVLSLLEFQKQAGAEVMLEPTMHPKPDNIERAEQPLDIQPEIGIAPPETLSAQAQPQLPPSQVVAQATQYIEPVAPRITYGEPIQMPEDTLQQEGTFIGSVHIGVDPTLSSSATNSERIDQTPAEYETEIRTCLSSRPNLFRVRALNGQRVMLPILFDGEPGTIVRNSDGRLVCASGN